MAVYATAASAVAGHRDVPEADVERLQLCRRLRASAMRLYSGMQVSIMIASNAELRVGDCCVYADLEDMFELGQHRQQTGSLSLTRSQIARAAVRYSIRLQTLSCQHCVETFWRLRQCCWTTATIPSRWCRSIVRSTRSISSTGRRSPGNPGRDAILRISSPIANDRLMPPGSISAQASRVG